MVEPGNQAEGSMRITIRLDAESRPDDMLNIVTRLASALRAQLNGIFVEDENLLALSHFPFAREVSMSGHVAAFDPQSILLSMRAQAAAARLMLERLASASQLQWQFDVLKGRALDAMCNAARHGDIIVIRSAALSGATARQSANMILIVPEGRKEYEGIVMAAEHAGLRLPVVNAGLLGEDHVGAKLAVMTGCPVVVLGVSPTEGQGAR